LLKALPRAALPLVESSVLTARMNGDDASIGGSALRRLRTATLSWIRDPRTLMLRPSALDVTALLLTKNRLWTLTMGTEPDGGNHCRPCRKSERLW
jgi:hypothetical protein